MIDVEAAKEEDAEGGLQPEGADNAYAAERLRIEREERPARRLVEALQLGRAELKEARELSEGDDAELERCRRAPLARPPRKTITAVETMVIHLARPVSETGSISSSVSRSFEKRLTSMPRVSFEESLWRAQHPGEHDMMDARRRPDSLREGERC